MSGSALLIFFLQGYKDLGRLKIATDGTKGDLDSCLQLHILQVYEGKQEEGFIDDLNRRRTGVGCSVRLVAESS